MSLALLALVGREARTASEPMVVDLLQVLGPPAVCVLFWFSRTVGATRARTSTRQQTIHNRDNGLPGRQMQGQASFWTTASRN